MKKSLVILAALALCGSVQAASYVWKATGGNIYDSSASSTKYSGVAYIFDAGVLAQSALYSAYAADTSYDFAANAAAALTISSGAIVTTSSANQFEHGAEGEATAYSFYMVVVHNSNIYFSNQISDKSILAPPTAQTLAFGSQQNGTSTFSNSAPEGTTFAGAGKWSAVGSAPVPEPTSGLLVMLGVGLMALRRRRA